MTNSRIQTIIDRVYADWKMREVILYGRPFVLVFAASGEIGTLSRWTLRSAGLCDQTWVSNVDTMCPKILRRMAREIMDKATKEVLEA